MKIAIVGHFDNTDEGTRIVAKTIARKLEERGLYIEKINISSKLAFWKIRKFKPDIIHFIISPTTPGLIFAKLLSLPWPKAQTIVSAVHSSLPKNRVLSVFKPNIVLVQSEESERLYKELGFNTMFLPNGVEITKFKPVSKEKKIELRKKYGLPTDKFIILHLASMKRKRNLEVFKTIKQTMNVEVLLVGRENEKNIDWELIKELKNAGCLVWIKHIPKIEEVYQLADCYIFPTKDRSAAIETPLSVLEAMACNLPVVTTKFGALSRMFKEGDGLFFVDNEDEIIKTVETLMFSKNALSVKTREKVLPYSWESIAEILLQIYWELTNKKARG